MWHSLKSMGEIPNMYWMEPSPTLLLTSMLEVSTHLEKKYRNYLARFLVGIPTSLERWRYETSRSLEKHTLDFERALYRKVMKV